MPRRCVQSIRVTSTNDVKLCTIQLCDSTATEGCGESTACPTPSVVQTVIKPTFDSKCLLNGTLGALNKRRLS